MTACTFDLSVDADRCEEPAESPPHSRPSGAPRRALGSVGSTGRGTGGRGLGIEGVEARSPSGFRSHRPTYRAGAGGAKTRQLSVLHIGCRIVRFSREPFQVRWRLYDRIHGVSSRRAACCRGRTMSLSRLSCESRGWKGTIAGQPANTLPFYPLRT